MGAYFFVFFLIVVAVIILAKVINRDQVRLNRITPHLEPEDKILDLGCGECCITRALELKGYQTTGIDIVDAGSCSQPAVYDGEKIPFDDKSFDVSVCAFVLHHASNYRTLVQELVRVTKRLIIIFEDTPENKMDRYFNKLHSGSDWGSCKECFLTRDEWLTIFDEHGVVEWESIPLMEFPFAGRPWIYPVHKTCFRIYLG